MRCLTLLLLFCALPCLAQDWAVRSGDVGMSKAEVETLTIGQTLLFYDGGRSNYSAGGAYSYTYVSGESAFGVFRIEADGTVCVSFRNGFGRCDRYVRNGTRVVLLTEKGERFPVKPEGSR